MNRRKTIKKPLSVGRLLGGQRNRRLRPKPKSEKRPAWDLRAAGRALLSGVIFALKGLALLIVAGGIGTSGYYGYKKVMTSSYFSIKQLQIRGAARAPESELLRSVQQLRGQHILTADLKAAERAVVSHPWVKTATLRRELPDQVSIQVVEEKPKAMLHLGHLYLLNSSGEVFKRATLSEAVGLPIITGIDRLEYLNQPLRAGQRITAALAALDHYLMQQRPPLSEIHLGPQNAITFYLKERGVALQMGRERLVDRLWRFDRVWAALGPESQRARVLYLDNEVRADRVVVRMGRNVGLVTE